MANKNTQIAHDILPLVGGKENVTQAVNCMTRLRLTLKDYTVVDLDMVKKTAGVLGCQETGGQLQIIVGTNARDVCIEFCKLIGAATTASISENLDAPKEKLTPKTAMNALFAYLSGSMTPLIPVLIAASLCKTIVAVFGPQLLGVMPEGCDLYTLFTFMGDAGFYFLPFIIAWSASKKLNTNTSIALLLAAIMMHPTFMALADGSTPFTVYGIPTSVQNYSSTVLPMLLVVWILSYVDRLLQKIIPDMLKVFAVPFLSVIVMTPLALCLLGPAGAFLGNYISGGIIALYDLVGPLATAILGATFGLLVCTGMHQLLFVYLFTTFPMLGYDSFLLPGILASSWVSLGVGIAAVIKFKKKENKTMILSYLITWFFGGVGEPLLYGLNLRYRTSLYASLISGGIAGFVAGILHLTAYVLNTSNGMYGLTAFLGGSTGNYIALGITLLVAVVAGFVCMMLLPLNDDPD